ncbi:hypothetical protein GGR57DRAFT_505597 [Xylariaceae sp. FL1272]|nr:hypothetical protein GGR57DRAFT_505597 [Xylariaceae sp. FL1272]
MTIRVMLSVLLLVTATIATAQTCYWLDGTISTNSQPCFPGQSGAQTCCHATHTCLSNGLCFDGVNLHVLRGACTEKGFGGDCVDQCAQDYSIADWGNLRQCNGGNTDWICGQDVSGCDDDSNIFTLTPGFVKDGRNATYNNVIQAGNITNDGVQQTSTTAGPTSTTAPPASTASAISKDECGDAWASVSTVGIAAGLGVGLPLLTALVVTGIFLARARKQLAATATPPSSSSIPFNTYHHHAAAPTAYSNPYEESASEVSGSNPTRYELPFETASQTAKLK